MFSFVLLVFLFPLISDPPPPPPPLKPTSSSNDFIRLQRSQCQQGEEKRTKIPFPLPPPLLLWSPEKTNEQRMKGGGGGGGGQVADPTSLLMLRNCPRFWLKGVTMPRLRRGSTRSLLNSTLKRGRLWRQRPYNRHDHRARGKCFQSLFLERRRAAGGS